jgi:NHL repeat
MSNLAIFLLLLVLCCRLSASATTSHDNNAKFQASSISTGIITTVAGYKILEEGDKSDGIPATSARLVSPKGLAIDKEGNFYISVLDKIQKVSASTGIITTVAGGGEAGSSSDYGDGGPGTSATLKSCAGLALDTNGNIYIADQGDHRIRKVTVSTGIITTVAGDGSDGITRNNVAATSTSLNYPSDVAVDASGNIYIADTYNGQIQKVTASTGIITTIAGNGVRLGYLFPRKSANATEFAISEPTGVALDSAGNVYIASGSFDQCIFKVTVSTGNISVVVGRALSIYAGSYEYNRFNTNLTIGIPMGVALDASGNIFISDATSHLIRKVTASTGVMTTVAGTGKNATEPYQGEGGSATLAPILFPYGIDVDAVANIYFSDFGLGVVKKVTYTAGSPSASVTLAPTVTRAPSTLTAPTPSVSSPSSPSVSKAPAVTPSASSPSSSSPSVSKAPAVTPSASSPFSSSPSVSKAPAVTPSASSPSSSAPAATSATGSQSSAATHAAQTLHATMILLSSLLILHLL